ncbi:low-density lipoprotein receptor-related protein 5-like [Dreissena polymorpha]|uniref:low-density lipoprotein receptor-related protein 5-like n=1 Tax=Dreissena polymorpha TaxID=45954 RepID=UPI002263C196|nr:low-density lipoprotein receptor-related protein 5-like [Dreissena polymorpha]
MFAEIWISRIFVVFIFAGEIFVSNAMSSGYLVLGGSGMHDSSDNIAHFLSLPTETANGHTKVYTNTSSRWLHYEDFLEQPMSIDVDYTRKQLYVYNSYTATLQNVQFDPEINGRNLAFKILHSGLSRSHVKIAIDWISNNIYWTDPTFRWIAIQSLQNHSHYMILIHDSGERPTGIALNPIHKYLFWSDVGSLPKIERSSLTGSDRKTIVSQGIVYPIALDVDIALSKLYWVDSERDTVERSNLDGTERTTIRRLISSTFFDIAVFALQRN